MSTFYLTWSFLTTTSILTLATKLSSENSEPVRNTRLVKDKGVSESEHVTLLKDLYA